MDEFVPLGRLLRDETTSEIAEIVAEPAAVPPPAELCATLAEVRRFRAALADALDLALETLLCDIAADVVARELNLDAADLAAIAERALRRFDGEDPLRLRVHADDVERVTGFGLAVVADASLRRGDLAIDLRSGSVDLTLGARLEAALLGTAK